MLSILWFCLYSGALAAIENSTEAEFADLTDIYNLNANLFLSWKLEVRMCIADTDAQKECWRVNSKFQRENANESMLSQSELEKIRQNLPEGKTVQDEVRRIISEESTRFEERAAAKDTVLNYGFQRWINGRVLHIPIPGFSPILTDARSRGLKSFTGGEFTIAQQLHGEDWFGLEPFPFVEKKYPVSWRMDALKGFFGNPPLFPADQMPANYEDSFSEFYKTTSGARRVADTTDATVVFCRRDGESQMLIAKILKNQGAFPRWVARWQLVDRTFESLSDEELLLAAQTSELFVSNVTAKRKREPFGGLQKLAVAHDVVQVPELGWYPSKIEYARVSALFRPGDDPRSPVLIDKGRVSQVVLEVLEVAALPPDALTPLVIPDGTAWLDVDTRESGVKGDPLPDSISELLTDRRSGSRTIFVVANAVLAVAVLLFLIIRRKKRSRE